MKRKIILIAFSLLLSGLFLVCSERVNYSHYDYLSSDDGKITLTLMQYNKSDEPETRGIYVVYGRRAKDGVLPTRNYFKMDYDTDPLWIKWGDDQKVRIIYSAGIILENHLESDTLQIFHCRTQDDFDRLVNGEKEKYKRVIISRLKHW